MSIAATYSRRIRRSLEGCRPKLSLRLCLFEEGYCLDLFGLLISLPFLDRWRYDPHEIMEAWGLYAHWDSIVWCWGDLTKFFHMPWELKHIKCEVLRPDGTWVPRVASYEEGQPILNKDGVVVVEGGKAPDGRQQWTMPYHYCTRNWEIQERVATFCVERREWRQKWLKWTSLFAVVRTYIDVTFSDEIGERCGSWKGGTVGCGYTLRKNETPQECLRRMEQERKFT